MYGRTASFALATAMAWTQIAAAQPSAAPPSSGTFNTGVPSLPILPAPPNPEPSATKGSQPATPEDIAADAKSGMLLRVGLAAGTAAVVQLPNMKTSDTRVTGVGTGAMPYLAFFPGVWLRYFGRDPGRAIAYCTRTVFDTKDPKEQSSFNSPAELAASAGELGSHAQNLMDDYAKADSDYQSKVHDARLKQQAATDTRDQVNLLRARAKLLQEAVGSESQDQRLAQARSLLQAQLSDAQAEADNKDHEAAVAFEVAKQSAERAETTRSKTLLDLRHRYHGSPFWGCLYSRLGFYVGVPGGYQANSSVKQQLQLANASMSTVNVVDSTGAGVTGPVDASRSIRPIISFGLAFAPIPQIHLIGGITVSNVQQDIGTVTQSNGMSVAAKGGSDSATWTWTVGIGGTLDVASLLGFGTGGGNASAKAKGGSS